MQSQDRALIQVCHFLAGGAGAWTAKDMKDLAALQGTCKDATMICKRVARERKPIAQAHRANMDEFIECIECRIDHARCCARDEGESHWRNPFTKEWESIMKTD